MHAHTLLVRSDIFWLNKTLHRKRKENAFINLLAFSGHPEKATA